MPNPSKPEPVPLSLMVMIPVSKLNGTLFNPLSVTSTGVGVSEMVTAVIALLPRTVKQTSYSTVPSSTETPTPFGSDHANVMAPGVGFPKLAAESPAKLKFRTSTNCNRLGS